MSLKIHHFHKKLFSLKPGSSPLFRLSFLCPTLNLFSLKNPMTRLTDSFCEPQVSCIVSLLTSLINYLFLPVKYY